MLLYRQAYNELDELVEKNLYSADGGATFAQSVDYRYNIRGWPTSINNSALQVGARPMTTTTCLACSLLRRDDEPPRQCCAVRQRVSAFQWQNAHFAEEQAYIYRYDAFNRLQAGLL